MAKISIDTNRAGIKTISPESKFFRINDGLIMSDRASIEIDENCPDSVFQTIVHAYKNGWIKPIAHVTDREYFYISLSHKQ